MAHAISSMKIGMYPNTYCSHLSIFVQHLLQGKVYDFIELRTRSSVGRAVVLYTTGPRFESWRVHHVGNCKFERFASLRSATNLYSILGVKTNSRFRKIWFEPMFFRNVVIAEGLGEESRLAA